MQTASVRLSCAHVLFMFGVFSACATESPQSLDRTPLRAKESVGPGHEAIAADDFESGTLTTLPWVVHGEASASAAAAHSGEFGAQIHSGSAIEARFSTVGMRGVAVSFALRGVGFEHLEHVAVEYSLNGVFFHQLGRILSEPWLAKTLRLPESANDHPTVFVRFTVHALDLHHRGDAFEGAYLDDFKITATEPMPPDAGTADGGMVCRSDTDCAHLAGPCVRGACDQASGACTSAQVAEGTACGEGRLCDANAQCLVCGAATSTFGLVQSTIFDSPAHACASAACHGRSPGPARLNLTAGASYAQLVNVTATLSPMLRVAPGAPDVSFFYRKIAWGTNGTPVTGGGPMPAGGNQPVTLRKLEGVGAWITAGAPEDGIVPGTVANFCEPPCASDADCSNANVCDGAERCVAAVCVRGTALGCDDGLACTADACDPADGCTHTSTPGLPCANGNGACDQDGQCVCNDGSTQPDCGSVGPTGQLTLRWNFATSEAVTSTPLVVGNVVYVTSWDGYVYALDRATGTERWRHHTGARAVQAGVARAPDGSLVVGDGEAVVWKLDPNGQVIWSRDLDNTETDHIWNAVTIHDGLIYVPIASHSDVPCTKGRIVALDLQTGALVWQRLNVPSGGVCRTDTAIECTSSADCPSGGACENAVGGAVTGRVLVDPGGSAIYVNTVGCYTFPQVGDTDAMMRLDAKTGAVQWLSRFSASEQFRYCSVGGADCRTDADCPSGSCVAKTAFHDFGFLNGPYLLDGKDAQGAPRPVLISASKSGTLYAVEPATGARVWTRAVLPPPVSPAFAGFGLFNGALAVADGLLFAALYEFVPPTTPAPPHLMAFSEVDGSTVWSDEIGRSWSSLTVDRGILYAGTQVANELYSYRARSGTRLGTFALPATTASAPSVAGDELFIGYGLSAGGGVRSYLIQ